MIIFDNFNLQNQQIIWSKHKVVLRGIDLHFKHNENGSNDLITSTSRHLEKKNKISNEMSALKYYAANFEWNPMH